MIRVSDNGPGMPPETVKSILDFTTRTSSREAYVAPDRGAQGNAWKTLSAMAFALTGDVQYFGPPFTHRVTAEAGSRERYAF